MYGFSDVDHRSYPDILLVLFEKMQKLAVSCQGNVEVMFASDAVKIVVPHPAAGDPPGGASQAPNRIRYALSGRQADGRYRSRHAS